MNHSQRCTALHNASELAARIDKVANQADHLDDGDVRAALVDVGLALTDLVRVVEVLNGSPVRGS